MKLSHLALSKPVMAELAPKALTALRMLKTSVTMIQDTDIDATLLYRISLKDRSRKFVQSYPVGILASSLRSLRHLPTAQLQRLRTARLPLK